MVASRPFRQNSDESSSRNSKGNSKANRLESAIPKSRSLKEIEKRLPGEEGSGQKSRPCVEKFAHHRRLLSLAGWSVQHIERMFGARFRLSGSAVGCPNVMFNV